jgi:hypothetical protein
VQIRVTVDVFSGRPNPSFILEGPEADDLAARLQPEAAVEDATPFRRVQSRLGYRGLVIEQLRDPVEGLPATARVAGGVVLGPERAYRPADEFTEDFVCGSTGPLTKIRPKPELHEFLRGEIDRTREWLDQKWRRPRPWPERVTCRCAPLYEPDWWNDGWGGQRQPNNNCYNYATNYRSDTYAQPGLAAGQMYGSITCADVLAAAVRDDLIDNPGADNRCPDEGHLVALVVGPGWDFHWYRKGRNGYWSHKPGGTEVTNIDNSGALIADPRNADRGSYTDFCTFMTVMHGHIKIQ